MERKTEKGDLLEVPQKRLVWPARIQLIGNALMGSLWAAAAAGFVVRLWPESSRFSVFLLCFIILAPIFSFLPHWLFILHPREIERKLKKETEEDDSKVINIRE